MRYRLLDTTRTFVLQIDLPGSAQAALSARHASHYRHWLERTDADWPDLANGAERTSTLADLANVRIALEWCFGPDGDAWLGVGLAAAAAPLFLAMSLLVECQGWSKRALFALDHCSSGGREEMHLQTALGLSLMFTIGSTDEALAALNRSMAIAEEREDALDQLAVHGPMTMFHLRVGDFRTHLHYAQRSATLSATLDDPAAKALSHTFLGISLHFAGDLAGARKELEEAQHRVPGLLRVSSIYPGLDHPSWAAIALARTLWLLGHPDQAMQKARRTVAIAADTGHPLTLAISLNWAVSVFLWAGDLDSAEAYTSWFLAHAETHSMLPYLALGLGYQGELAIRRGNAASGVEMLEACLKTLHAARYELLTTAFNITLIEGLSATRRAADALALLDDTIRLIETKGDLVFMPELLRMKGTLLLAEPRPAAADAERCFRQSIEMSRHDGALAWELRTAIDLAALLARQGKRQESRTLLRPLFDQFTEGGATADLKAANAFLETLGQDDDF